MYDLLIKNGLVVDGSGDVPFLADVAVVGDSIAKIGHIDEPAKKVIDAQGKIVTPGFIDIHCHSDAIVFQPGKNPKRLQQGFTTEVVGNCGISCAPITPEFKDRWAAYCAPFFSHMPVPFNWNSYDEYLKEVEKNQLCLNMAGLVGHGTVRACVAGFEDRPFTEEEMHKAEKFLADSMEAGAFGFSSGLIYPPGVLDAGRDGELCACRQGARRYCQHIRSESYGLIDAVTEAIHIAEETGVSVEISITRQPESPTMARSARPADDCRRPRKGARCELRRLPLRCGQHQLQLHSPAMGAGGRY
ncbi:MAG: amidohydrolase family protein [Christensenellales bacterium]